MSAHGTVTRYANEGCRCGPCITAGVNSNRRHAANRIIREAKRDEQAREAAEQSYVYADADGSCPRCGGSLLLDRGQVYGEPDTVKCAACAYSPPPSPEKRAALVLEVENPTLVGGKPRLRHRTPSHDGIGL